MTKFIYVYITNPSKPAALKVAKHLLSKRLIACVNLFPIESIYWWKGKLETTKEFVLIAKTVSKNFDKVKKEVERIHPYETPCIVRIPVSSNEKYFNWLKGEVRA